MEPLPLGDRKFVVRFGEVVHADERSRRPVKGFLMARDRICIFASGRRQVRLGNAALGLEQRGQMGVVVNRERSVGSWQNQLQRRLKP